jgi:site-specific DNA recombinase
LAKGLKVVGYVRVSQVAGREGSRFISPDVQRDTLAGFVKGRGHKLVTVLQDLDESGGTLDRPGLQQALTMLAEGEVDAICVARLDRLSRKVVEGLGLVQQVTGMGRHVLLADLDLDSSTPTGKAMLAVALAFAELELDQRSAAWAVAQRKAMERGAYPGTTPLGYTRGKDGKLIRDPVRAPVIQELFARRVKGESWSALARWLDEAMPRDDGTGWRPSTVRAMLRTPAYVGRLERRIGGEQVIVEGKHEALVDRALYEAANASKSRGPQHRDEPAKLAGLVRCATCGGPMSRHGNGRVKQYESYSCLRRCAAPARISLPTLDKHVLGLVLDRLAESAQIAARRSRNGTSAVTDADVALSNAERELDEYLASVSASDVGRDAFARGAQARKVAVDEARAALADVKAREQITGPSSVDLLALLPTMGDGAMNTVLRTLVSEVAVSKAGRPGMRGDLSARVRVAFHDEPKHSRSVSDQVVAERAPIAA